MSRRVRRVRNASLIDLLASPQVKTHKLWFKLLSEYMKERLKASNSKGDYKPSLLKALIRCFGLKYLLCNIIVVLNELVVK